VYTSLCSGVGSGQFSVSWPFSLVVMEPVEVEELVKVCAFNWWIVGIVDRFASKDFEC